MARLSAVEITISTVCGTCGNIIPVGEITEHNCLLVLRQRVENLEAVVNVLMEEINALQDTVQTDQGSEGLGHNEEW